MARRNRLEHVEEHGSGLISTSLGTLVLMSLLLFSLHVLLALHTRTVVGAAAWDAARAMSIENGASNTQAEERVRGLIGGLKPRIAFAGTNDEVVVVTVTAKSPGFMPGVTKLTGLRTVTRTATIRREGFR